MGTRKHGDESTKGAQTTKLCFVVCSLDSRRVFDASRVRYVLFLPSTLNLLTYIYRYILQTNPSTRERAQIYAHEHEHGARGVFFFSFFYIMPF